MVCLPSNPVNHIYNILTQIVPNTKPLAGQSAPTCVCHGSTGKIPALQPQCSLPRALPSSSGSQMPPLREGPKLSTSCSSFLCAGACPLCRRGFCCVHFPGRNRKQSVCSLEKDRGVSAVSSSDPSSGGWQGGQ